MHNNIRILIVDDEDGLRETLRGELIEAGYSAETAADGDLAIPLIEKQVFDLVLLDIKMTRVHGLEVLTYIKKNFPAVKVIMLTAFADLKNAMASKKLGANDFISKPYDLYDLMKTI